MKKKIVVLSGAGISAESGLKTFRDGDGLWENYRVEDVATPEAWRMDKERVLRFYNERRRQVIAAKPNAAHWGIAALEKDFEVTVITQNIDDLHERAGSTNVLHLHGAILKMRSVQDERRLYDIYGDIRVGDLAPDGGQLRPHIVWFGEAVPMIEIAIPLVEAADIFILIGSSLAVYPAAGLIDFLPSQIPKYIIDPSIPTLPKGINFYALTLPATEGMQQVVSLLGKPGLQV